MRDSGTSNDSVIGGDGHDYIIGGDGDDVIQGALGLGMNDLVL